MKTCVVIPAFNNERTILEVVENTRREVNHVVVIDDGSTDQTVELAKRAGAHVMRIARNRGKGHALAVAFKYACERDFEAIITLDADLQHDPSEIPKFIDCHMARKSGIVIGNRFHDKRNIPHIRYGPNKIGIFTFSWLIDQTIEDSQCGFRLYDRSVIEQIPILNDGFEAETDILLRAGKRGFKIDFVPIKTIYFQSQNHRSYYRPIRDTFRISIIFLMNLFWKNR